MALVKDIRKTITDTAPVYAAVGVTDLAAEKVRDATSRATTVGEGLRKELEPAALQDRAAHRANTAVARAQQVPGLALSRSVELAERAQHGYTDLVARGERLVRRVRRQQATADLVAQAENTVSLGKGALTTARRAAKDVERSAKATLTTGRKETTVAADAVADSVAVETRSAEAAVQASAARTRTAAKRTATTSRNSAKKSATSAKRAATTARKTGRTSAKAVRTAATKVGN